jgi:hypothetical protein
MAAQRFSLLRELGKCIRLSLGTLTLLVAACLAATPSAHAQAAVEYGGATSVSAGAVSSKPQVFTPGGGGPVNHSLFLAKPKGTPPEEINREWFAKQAGKEGGQLAIDATPPRTSVWVDGKFVGKAPLTLTLAAGKHHLSLLGPRQEHAERDVNIVTGKNDRLTIQLQETYPSSVAIRVFGGVQH